jgi:hypothetical protein
MNHPQWKYLVSEIGAQLFGPSATERIREELAKRGAQGWELVTVQYDPNSLMTRLYFKQAA